ncbi:DUF3173 domain-containing protein [Lactococcus garvieae]|uniref:DUF3173 domain-containing protein n=1 Tax=Lactococcus garvieae TaxID=1363 RepID=A0AA43T792_9LACT|nr:DUF3173 domain-containing protein [Lactococcus garvieae]MDH7959436.1 DUF3173 domain-containing protein [Lactococcus garvieae]BDM76552.1 hypothetical protein LGMS210922A_14970 [Lactococcus garvieae]BDW51820.1 hypothetical protein LG21E68_14950 [Lactococcus garvieae]
MAKLKNNGVIQYKDLVDLGYTIGTSRSLIRQAKQVMINKGFTFYDNKRLGTVPLEIVEEILGVTLYG